MTKECQEKRLIDRHGNDKMAIDFLTKIHTMYEPAGDDEPNAIHCLITKDMTRDDVLEKILQLLKEHGK